MLDETQNISLLIYRLYNQVRPFFMNKQSETLFIDYVNLFQTLIIQVDFFVYFCCPPIIFIPFKTVYTYTVLPTKCVCLLITFFVRKQHKELEICSKI